MDENVCIVAHNVFWFQGVPFATDTPPAPCREILERLCALYKETRADVLCLQEIQSKAAARTVAETLNMKYIFSAGGGYPQYGGAVFSRWPMEEISLPQDILPDRVLQQVRIYPEKNHPLSLVNTHLPSHRQRGAAGGQKQRLQELSLVARQADLLLGDFNEKPDGRCAAFLEEQGYIDVAQMCSARNEATNLAGAAGFRGDHIWLSKEKADLLQGYFVIPQERLALEDAEKTFLSDHLPIGCTLRVKSTFKESS
jgi:endonuclease/exonuclease/phosphatase family metal-dependent hydrolase